MAVIDFYEFAKIIKGWKPWSGTFVKDPLRMHPPPPGSPLLSCHPIPSPSSASVHHPDHVGQPAPCPHLSTEGSTTNNSRSLNYFAACIIYVRNQLLGSEHPVCRCWRLKDVKTLFYCPQEVWGRSGSWLLVGGPSSRVTHAIHDHWTVCG